MYSVAEEEQQHRILFGFASIHFYCALWQENNALICLKTFVGNVTHECSISLQNLLRWVNVL